MNIFTTRKLLLAVMTAAFSSTTLAGLPAFGGLPDFSTLVRHRAEAEKLPVGTKVALACKTCQARNMRTVDEKKTFLAWFDPKMTQKCSGCGGQMTLKKTSGGKSAKANDYTHVCSKCGDDSAAVCIATAKKAKS